MLTVSPPKCDHGAPADLSWQIVIESVIFAGHLATAGWLKAIINNGWGGGGHTLAKITT